MRFSSIRYLMKEGVKNIWSNRTMSLASVAVLVSCLMLTGVAVLFSINISNAMQAVEDNNSITVYMTDNLPTLKSAQVGEEIRKLPNVATCEFVPKDEAVERYMRILGDDGTIFEGLTGKDNFLPDAFKISMKDLSKYNETAAKIKAIAGVSRINDYSEIATKLTNLNRLVTTAGFWIVLLLSVVSLFIISNTIRVTMFTRRLEISIMKSVGATNGFVRLPFVVEGILIGILSGALSSLLLDIIYSKMLTAVSSLVPSFSPIPIDSMLGSITLCFVGAGILFGAIGGMISISKYLKKEGAEVAGW